MRADVDQQQNLHAGFGMFLFGKDNPAIVSDRASKKARKLSAQMMGFQARVVEVFRHAPQRRFDLRLQRGIFPDYPAERPFKFRREDEFAHGLLALAQPGDDTFGGLAFEFAGTKGFDCQLCFCGSVLPPSFNAAAAQQILKHFLLVGRQCLGFAQNAI
jgi:hypothetical protein